MPAAKRPFGKSRLTPGREVHVALTKARVPYLEYQAAVLFDDGNHVIVRGPWAEPVARDVGFAVFEPGDVFTEHYWRDRWYSVKEVRTANGALKGWYCDVARPVAISGRQLVSDDLDLDLWLSADGQTILRLDEDEFVASGLAERDPEAARRAREALDELARLAAARFDSLDRTADAF